MRPLCLLLLLLLCPSLASAQTVPDAPIESVTGTPTTPTQPAPGKPTVGKPGRHVVKLPGRIQGVRDPLGIRSNLVRSPLASLPNVAQRAKVRCRLDRRRWEPCARAQGRSVRYGKRHQLVMRACNSYGCDSEVYRWRVARRGCFHKRLDWQARRWFIKRTHGDLGMLEPRPAADDTIGQDNNWGPCSLGQSARSLQRSVQVRNRGISLRLRDRKDRQDLTRTWVTIQVGSIVYFRGYTRPTRDGRTLTVRGRLIPSRLPKGAVKTTLSVGNPFEGQVLRSSLLLHVR